MRLRFDTVDEVYNILASRVIKHCINASAMSMPNKWLGVRKTST